MSVEENLLRNLAAKVTPMSAAEVWRWCAMAASVLDIEPDQVGPDNVDLILEKARELIVDDTIRLKGRHDYLTESKALPYEVFTKGILLIWSGSTSKVVEAQTGLGHQTQAQFNKWWRLHDSSYDRTDLRRIYLAFLQRNLNRSDT